jgi:hypothetical protein
MKQMHPPDYPLLGNGWTVAAFQFFFATKFASAALSFTSSLS